MINWGRHSLVMRIEQRVRVLKPESRDPPLLVRVG